MTESPVRSRTPLLTRALGIRPDEVTAVALSFTYFFCLLSSYYMLRSVRETMAIVSGVQTIPLLFTGTFVTMIAATAVFGLVTSRFARKTFLPWVYYFFIANIAVFYATFVYAQANELSQVWIARAFFVWISVFNLFVVSVFWSFMADIYTKEQSRRLFGVISAGGSTGAILGPTLTSLVVVPIGFQNLLPLSALLLVLAIVCVYRLRQWTMEHETGAQREAVASDKPIGGSALAGFKFVLSSPFFAAIAGALLLTNFLGGAIYFYMADVVSQAFPDTDTQTQVFARLDALTSALSFVGQFLIVRLSVQRLGVGRTLMVVPIISVIGFAVLAFNPTFIVLATLQVLRRSIGFGLTKPTNDMIYSVVTPEERYKAKNFIETAVYRGSDLVTAWTVRALGNAVGITGVALVCVPVAMTSVALVRWIGRQYRQRFDALSPSSDV